MSAAPPRPRVVVLRPRGAGLPLLALGAAVIAWTAVREAHVASVQARLRAAHDALLQAETAWVLTPSELARAEAAPLPDDEAARLERRIEELALRIKTLASERRVEELIDVFARFRALLVEAEAHPVLRDRVAAWSERIVMGCGEGSARPRLQLAVSRGNEALRAMATSLRAEEWGTVEVAWRDLSRTADGMEAEQRDVFRRNAAALRARGEALRRRAQQAQALARR